MAESVPLPAVSTTDTPSTAVETTADSMVISPTTVVPAASTSAGESDALMEKAKKQVEFYFADANLPYDKFLWTLQAKDPEHWVPIATVAGFKRMKEYTPFGPEWLLKALRLSTWLQVNEAGDKIRRTTEVQKKDDVDRSVYAKGFGEEDETTQARLEGFFAAYGPTNSVRMRRDQHKKFKGSVFTEFADFDVVERFLKADPKPSWEGKELLIMTKEEYCEMKIKEKGLTGKAAVHRRELIASGRGFDAFKEMEGGGGQSSKRHDEAILEYIGNRVTIRRDGEGNGSVKPEDVPYVKGATLRFDGCGGDCTWSDIKDPLKEKFDGRPPYIKYQRGDDFGLVGFHKALTEEEVGTVKEAVKMVNGKEVTWSVPDEETEKAFQIERAQIAAKSAFMQLDKQSGGARSGRGGGRGRGGRGAGGRGAAGRGAGGRGGGRGRGGPGRGRGRPRKEEGSGGDAGAEKAGEGEVGEKRKRGVEPDSGLYAGTRGTDAPPALTRSESATKKAKVDGEP